MQAGDHSTRTHVAEWREIDKCVHCGFCLPTCPTYLLDADEMDSPRGRIYLLKAALEDRISVGASFAQHFDSCLGCMGCVTACPSGVDYAPLIETARQMVSDQHRRSATDRLFRDLLFRVLPYPARLRIAALPLPMLGWLFSWNLLGWLPGRLRALTELGAALARRAPEPRVDHVQPTAGPARLRVALLTGCVQRVFFDHVNQATARVLSAEGCEVVIPEGQGCCGALSLHAGRGQEARALARQTIATFEATGVDCVAVNAAGCGSALKEIGRVFEDDPVWSTRARAFSAKVKDVSEILDELGPLRSKRSALPLRVAYHDACHLGHAQGVRNPPRALLRSIPELELVPLSEPEICCGSAGIHNLVEPRVGQDLGTRKVARIGEAHPDVVATANPGCLLQIEASAHRAGRRWPILHPIELLDASIRGVPVAEILARGGASGDGAS